MSKRLLLAVASTFVVLVTPLSAAYYQQDLFPIGLSGIMHTGYDTLYHRNTPYGSEGWTWLNELQLIDNLGVNCLGSEDSYKGYIITFSGSSDYDYLNQVCAGLDKIEKKSIF